MRAGRTVALGAGEVVPYPQPTSDAATSIGKANRRSDTGPERALRSALHRSGLRFRKDYPVRTAERLVRVDIAFTRQKLAVQVDGCFWHCCPEHGRIPGSNRSYWVPKLEANVARDQRADRLLREAGWAPLRVWEHVPVDEAVDLVGHALDELRR